MPTRVEDGGVNFLARLKRRTGRWLADGGGLRRGLYYGFFSDIFLREQNAVALGIKTYRERAGSEENVYLLRRNVHMLEKGLTMSPRRPVFALDYIESTTAAYIAHAGKDRYGLGDNEKLWMRSVLEGYWSATELSDAPEIVRAHASFEDFHSDQGPGVELLSLEAPHLSGDLESPIALDDFLTLAKSRRSVRWFQQTGVPRAIVDASIEAALEAPTACNRQPYRFEVLDDAASISKVVSIPMGTKGYGHQVPGLVVIVGDLSAFFDERDRHLIYVDASLAAMNFVMALTAAGVGSCCINWPDLPDREKQMREVLGLKHYERVVMLVAYGYADPRGLVPVSSKMNLSSVRSYRTL